MANSTSSRFPSGVLGGGWRLWGTVVWGVGFWSMVGALNFRKYAVLDDFLGKYRKVQYSPVALGMTRLLLGCGLVSGTRELVCGLENAA